MPDKIKILVVDDSLEYIEGLYTLFAMYQRFEIVKAFTSAKELLNFEHCCDVDLILVDINMSEIEGLNLVKIVQSYNSTAKFIAITMDVDALFIKEIKRAGFMGVVHKPKTYETLFNCIESVFDNRIYFEDKRLYR